MRATQIGFRLSRGKSFRDLKYLTLGITPPLKSVYNDESVAKTWTETDTLQYLRQTRELTKSILEELVDMTDLGQEPFVIPPIRSRMSHLDPGSFRFNEHGSLVLTPPLTIPSLLQKLTSYRYNAVDHLKVTHWLHKIARYLVRLEYPQHHPQLSAMYSSLIGFFLSTNDLQMAFYILNAMENSRLLPSRSSLHYFLEYNAKYISINPYYRDHVGHPLINVKSCLTKFKAMGVHADELTWNLVLQCMPFGFGKSFIVEEMNKRAIPLNTESRRVLLKTILEDRKVNETQTLAEKLDPKDPVVFQLIIDKLLGHKIANNANVVRAWNLLKSSSYQDTSTDMMNIFLRRFAARRHFDWQLGVLQHFPQTEWNDETWQYLLEAIMFGFDTAAKPAIIGTILKEAEREKVNLTSRARYLARRAQKYPLRDMGREAWQMLKTGLKWKEALRPHQPIMLHLIGFGKNTEPAELDTAPDIMSSSEPAVLDTSRFVGLPRTDTLARRADLNRRLSGK